MTVKMGRKRRPRQARSAARKPASTSLSVAQVDIKDTEIARLSAELAGAQSKLQEIEEKGTEAYTVRKLEGLLEAAQVARGQAFDASLARNRAEGDLRTLKRAIMEAPGPAGWLLRRAARRVLGQLMARPG